MNRNEVKSNKLNKWEVETNPLILRRLGKTGEELAELSKVINRVILQGLDGENPNTLYSNLDDLHDEIADVYAQLDCTINSLNLSKEVINHRRQEKVKLMAEWESMYT